MLVIGLAQTSAGTSVGRSLGLTAKAEPFTELYFQHPAQVAALTEGTQRLRSRTRVGFVVANHEARAMDYAWQLRTAGAVRATGHVSVPAGQQRTVRTAAVSTGCGTAPRATTKPRRGHRTRTAAHSSARAARRSARAAHSSVRTGGPARTQITVSLSSPQRSIDYLASCHA